MSNAQPPSYIKRFIDLPLARLHTLETGQGEPLILVPATISELDDWRPLAQFMGQWFRVHYFELPGHGQSEAFRDRFSSHQVAELVAQLTNHLGYERFNLMGFSFGGILAMRTFKFLSHQIDRVIFIAPCLDHRALPISHLRLRLLYKLNQLLGRPSFQAGFVRLIHNPRTLSLVVKALQKFGRLEETIPLKYKLARIRASTVTVLNAQIHEILTTEFDVAPEKHETPCYFAMSIYDPLLRFDTTHSILQNHFTNISALRLTYPFHQPPTPFTFNELNRDFYETVNAFLRGAGRQSHLPPMDIRINAMPGKAK